MDHFDELFTLLRELNGLLGRDNALEVFVEYNRIVGMPLLAVRFPPDGFSPLGIPLSLGTLDQAVAAARERVKTQQKYAQRQARDKTCPCCGRKL